MKICIFTHTFPKFEDDISAPFMDGLAQAMVNKDDQVFVLTPFINNLKIKRKNRDYKIFSYKYIFPDSLHQLGYSQTLENDMSLRPLMVFLSPFLFFFSFFALLNLVKKEKIDVINAHWILPNGFVASLVSKITGVPLVTTLPGSDVYMAFKNPVFKMMAKVAADGSSKITSNSPQLLQDLSRLSISQEKFSNIIYGVDPAYFKPQTNKTSLLRKELKISDGKLIVLGVGRLVAKKGFKYLIEAAKDIISKSENICFVIIGDGDQKEELEERIKSLGIGDYFRLVSSINYKALVNYYNLADIFILPSIRDEQGNLDDQSVALVEAMACGKPVITTNFPGYRVVVKDGFNGYLTKPGSSKQIAKYLIKLASDTFLRKKMGENSRELVVNNFSWNAIGKTYLDLFFRIIKTHKATTYSQQIPKILNEQGRIRVASQISATIKSVCKYTKNLNCLDIGCSNGIITNQLAKDFKSVTGIDVDEDALLLAKKRYQKNNLRFKLINCLNLDFPNNSFDVIVCNQVFGFTEKPEILSKEIFRVLKKGGICLVGVRNKYSILEGQTGLPLIHGLPDIIIRNYLHLTRKKYYIPHYLGINELNNLFSNFQVTNLTSDILKNPKNYGFNALVKYKFLFANMAQPLMNFIMPIVPNYILILKK